MNQKPPEPGRDARASEPPTSPKPHKRGLNLELPALLAGLVLGAAAALYWADSTSNEQAQAQTRQDQTELLARRAELAQLHAQLDALTGQLVMEESTRKGLEATLQASQTELGRARDQLAFFDQLLPPGPKGAIGIRALDIVQLGPTLQYKVLLMRNVQDDKPFVGFMQFVAHGVQKGKPVKIVLQPALVPGSSAASAAEQIKGVDLNFDQFQHGGGLLSIPEGFTPQAITLNIFEGSTLRVSRTVNLPAAE